MKYIEWTEFNNIRAFTTTRELGNVAYQVGNNYESVRKVRGIISHDLQLNEQNVVFVHQTHSDIIKEVTIKDLGKGMLSFESGIEADALYTKEKGIALGIFHADCVPIFFYIPNKEIIGIIHAGHQGTLKRIAEKSIEYLKKNEQVDSKDIYVHIGPSRKFFSYTIDKIESDYITSIGYEKALKFNGGEVLFDAPLMNYLQLIKTGVNPSNITITDEDTYDNPHLYSAYQKTPVGRMASIILRK